MIEIESVPRPVEMQEKIKKLCEGEESSLDPYVFKALRRLDWFIMWNLDRPEGVQKVILRSEIVDIIEETGEGLIDILEKNLDYPVPEKDRNWYLELIDNYQKKRKDIANRLPEQKEFFLRMESTKNNDVHVHKDVAHIAMNIWIHLEGCAKLGVPIEDTRRELIAYLKNILDKEDKIILIELQNQLKLTLPEEILELIK